MTLALLVHVILSACVLICVSLCMCEWVTFGQVIRVEAQTGAVARVRAQAAIHQGAFVALMRAWIIQPEVLLLVLSRPRYSSIPYLQSYILHTLTRTLCQTRGWKFRRKRKHNPRYFLIYSSAIWKYSDFLLFFKRQLHAQGFFWIFEENLFPCIIFTLCFPTKTSLLFLRHNLSTLTWYDINARIWWWRWFFYMKAELNITLYRVMNSLVR